MSEHRPGVAVIGSVNLDMVVRTARRPLPGETVLGTDYQEVFGGKGLNQAVAAARTSRTTLIAAVGDDDAGDRARLHLAARGVSTIGLSTVAGPTGRALITVTPDGENSIVVAPMANARLDADVVIASLGRVRPAVVVLQREVPPPVITAALAWAEREGVRAVYNPSPAHEVDLGELATADPLVVNVHEARDLARAPQDTTAEVLVERCATFARSVVVTAGRDGSWVHDPTTVVHVPAEPDAHAVDTTGAGDEFAGSLAAHLATGATLEHAVRLATQAAARLIATPRADR